MIGHLLRITWTLQTAAILLATWTAAWW